MEALVYLGSVGYLSVGFQPTPVACVPCVAQLSKGTPSQAGICFLNLFIVFCFLC